VVELLNERTKGFGTKLGELIVLPIYSTLPSHEQSKIFEETPPGARKVCCSVVHSVAVCCSTQISTLALGFQELATKYTTA